MDSQHIRVTDAGIKAKHLAAQLDSWLPSNVRGLFAGSDVTCVTGTGPATPRRCQAGERTRHASLDGIGPETFSC